MNIFTGKESLQLCKQTQIKQVFLTTTAPPKAKEISEEGLSVAIF